MFVLLFFVCFVGMTLFAFCCVAVDGYVARAAALCQSERWWRRCWRRCWWLWWWRCAFAVFIWFYSVWRDADTRFAVSVSNRIAPAKYYTIHNNNTHVAYRIRFTHETWFYKSRIDECSVCIHCTDSRGTLFLLLLFCFFVGWARCVLFFWYMVFLAKYSNVWHTILHVWNI